MAVKDRGVAIKKVYADLGVDLPESSGLGQLIGRVSRLSDARLTNQLDNYTAIDFFDVLHLDRVARPVLALPRHQDATPYLRKLISGTLNFFERQPSDAKDTLWELELWELLLRRNASASLVDPPDITISLQSGELGIACKKLYSESNLEKTLSKGAKQVESHFAVGVVAINIDELVPADKVLAVENADQMNARLRSIVDDFMLRHEGRFRKYLAAARLVGVVVTVNVVVDVKEWDVKINNARQSTVWAFPGIDVQSARKVRDLENLILQ